MSKTIAEFIGNAEHYVLFIIDRQLTRLDASSALHKYYYFEKFTKR